MLCFHSISSSALSGSQHFLPDIEAEYSECPPLLTAFNSASCHVRYRAWRGL